MKKKALSILLTLALCLTLLPATALAADPAEQFSGLTPGGTYWFDLSGADIPGTVNEGEDYGGPAVPDATLHWVPFTYAGTVDAYVLKSRSGDDETAKGDSANAAGSTDPSNPIGYTYDHSLFIADYGVTHKVNWDTLDGEGLIFGKSYTSGGVNYTLRAPSAGSNSDTSGVTPASNEWDAILGKDSNDIKNWSAMYSWGQDTCQVSNTLARAVRGNGSAHSWNYDDATDGPANLGFRPVLEILNPDTLGSDDLTTVTLDLNGGSIGTVEGHITTGEIHLVTKKGESYTAPSSDGLTRPDGNDGTYFKWQDSSGNFYKPGEQVPADVTRLTALWELPEQFSGLTTGETYWFDLSGANIPGNKNGSLPDDSLHWVPFTYAGTVNAYVLKSRSANDSTARGDSANAAGSTDPNNPIGYTYDHSLFIADYNVTSSANWNHLNGRNLIFGTAYTSGGVDYTLRAPSAGSSGTASGGTPASNEWDAILDKDSDYIKNWNGMYSWGQDTQDGPDPDWNRATRGSFTARSWQFDLKLSPSVGFRPVLELPSSDTLGSDGLTTVTLDLNGGSIGSITGTVNLAVKSDFELTLPDGTDVTRPTGNTGAYFKWQDSSGNFYEPGDTVPADVGRLTALWELPEQFTTLTPGGTYWFDLSGADIPGDKNDSLPDKTLRWVPFTYAGTVDAYVLNKNSNGVTNASEDAANTYDPNGEYGYTYDHSLFIADYGVTHTVSWNDLNEKNLIFGKGYTSRGVDYTLRAPSAGMGSTDSKRGIPLNNEWDAIWDKNSDDIKNWKFMYSWGQDTYRSGSSTRASRGVNSARGWTPLVASHQEEPGGFRPVLEILNSGTLGSDDLTTVTLDLNGGSIGSITGAVNLAVKSSGTYTAPSRDGLTRPTGNTGAYFKWQDSSGNFYEPGAQVPADVTHLTARWKDVPTVSADNITVTYTGSPVPASAITGTASVDGTWSFKATAPMNVADSSNNVTVVFTPTDTDTYETVEDIIKVTINKATPTGTPAYTAITIGGKTLADAALSVGSITPAGGSIVWDLGDAQPVSANTAYNWTYTPADTDNYNNLTGSITPYVVSYSGGGSSSGGGSTPTYPPTVEQPDEGGTVTVSPKNPEKGDTVTITPKPEDGYVVDEVTVTDKDGKPVEVTDNGDGSYSFTQPSGKVTVTVTFTDKTKIFFVDVFPGDYYYDAVLWAAKNGITGGVDDTHFAPNAPCTRAQIVTFLWRAAGSPVVNYAMNFSDVPADAYYAEAVRWAVSQGITKGTSDTTFSPDATCTRAQAMTFIYRSVQAQGGGMQGAWMFRNPFSDVDTENYYGEAVMWAVANGVTSGTSDTTFSPSADCTRAQIVTFLYRCLGDE